MARKNVYLVFVSRIFRTFPLENPLEKSDDRVPLETLGPEQLTIWVIFYVESEFQVEHARFLHPEPENKEKQT